MKKFVGVKAKGVLQRMQKATCLVLAQRNTYFRGNCMLFNCLTELRKDVLGACFDGIALLTF